MPAPTAYPEAIFADYLVSVLGNFASLLGWDAGSVQVIEAINDVELELGITNTTAMTTSWQLRGLRALGRRAIWRAVIQAVAADYTTTDSNQTLERELLQKQALKALELAEVECREFDPSYAVSIVNMNRPADPYIVLQDSQRLP